MLSCPRSTRNSTGKLEEVQRVAHALLQIRMGITM